MKKSFIQFVKFGIVGVTNTLADFIVYTVLVSLTPINYVIAQAISYSCGVLNSYLLNTAWTFKKEKRRDLKEFITFVPVNIFSLGVSIGPLYLCKNYLFDDGVAANWLLGTFAGSFIGSKANAIEILSKVVATPISIVVNFVGNKLVVFKNKNEDAPEVG